MAAFKDEVAEPSIRRLADVLSEGTGFSRDLFVAVATVGLDELELKARIAHVADALAGSLPSDVPEALSMLRERVAPSGLDGWAAWPAVTYVERHGLGHPADSFETLRVLTPLASAEFAVRPFIDVDPGLARATFDRWVDDGSEHVRRLVSEGTRLRLPWGRRVAVLEGNPGWAVGLLDRLRDDPSPYVRRSVANHMNDIAKVDRDLAVEVAKRWMQGGSEAVVRHGLRVLIKAGDPDALRVVGIDPDVTVSVERFEVSPTTLRLGESLELLAELRIDGSAGRVELLVDYALHLLRANGSSSRKVFKLRTLSAMGGEPVVLRWRCPIRPVSVRRYYAGAHRVDLQVNGNVVAEADFELLVE